MKENLYNAQREALNSTIEQLKARLEKLREKFSEDEILNEENDLEESDSQNEDEKIRGFTDGGASTEETEEEAEEQIAMLEAEIKLHEEELEITSAKEVIDEILQEAEKSGALKEVGDSDQKKGGMVFSCESSEDAEKLAKAIAGQFERLGFECDISKSKDGKVITVTVNMPEQFKDKNPLQMSAGELREARDILKNDKEQNSPNQKSTQSNNQKSEMSWGEKILGEKGASAGLAVQSGSWASKVTESRASSHQPPAISSR